MAYLIILIDLILACSSVLSYRIDVEPKCSPFEYEEKTLAKMIRIEHEMEIMTKKVDHNLKTLREELVEFDSMKLRLDEQLESSQKSIEVMKEDQDVFKQKLLDGKFL